MSLINDALKRARQAHQQQATSPGGEVAVTVPSPLQPVEDSAREKPQRLLVVIPVLLLSLGAAGWFFRQSKHSETQATPSAGVPGKAVPAKAAQAGPKNPVARAAETMKKWEARQDEQTGESLAPVSATASIKQDPGTPPAPVVNSTVTAQVPSRTIAVPTDGQSQKAAVGTTLPAAWANLVAAPASTRVAPLQNPSVPPSATPTGIASAVEAGTSASVTAYPTKAPESSGFSPVFAATQPVDASEPAKPASDFKLQGIFFRMKNPTALIDGRIISVGDDLEGYRVTLIDRHTVKMLASGRTHTLTLR